MSTRNTLKGILFFLGLGAVTANSAVVSRIKNWSDNEILYSSDLNGEFNNLISGGINSISDANIVSNAAIDPKKIAAGIAGSGITRNGTTGVLTPTVDGTSIDVSGGNLEVAALGITTAKIAANAVTTATILDGNVTLTKLSDPGFYLSASLSQTFSNVPSFSTFNGIAALVVTTHGRKVWVGLVPDDAGSGNSAPTNNNGRVVCSNTSATSLDCAVAILGTGGGNFVVSHNFGSTGASASMSVSIPCASFYGVDTAGLNPGTRSYTLQGKTAASTNASISIQGCKLFAYEF